MLLIVGLIFIIINWSINLDQTSQPFKSVETSKITKKSSWQKISAKHEKVNRFLKFAVYSKFPQKIHVLLKISSTFLGLWLLIFPWHSARWAK